MQDDDLRGLLVKVKASDHNAFKTLFHLFQESLYNFLLFKTKDHALAEDLLQEAFLKVWNGRSAINVHLSFKSYLYTICDHLVLNHIRHLKVVEKHERLTKSKLFSDTYTPQSIMEEQEWNTRIMQVIEELPEKTRTIFLMNRIEDLTYQEIADVLSISIKTVEGHIVKALKTLRETTGVKV
jgi:RNA polymerase sigma-70 factor (family 1)